MGKLRDDRGSIESILAEIDFVIMAQHDKELIDFALSPILVLSYTVYSRYIAIVYIAELDISWSHIGPHFLAPKNAIFFAKSQ